jgi:ribonuclease VapC
MNKVVLDASAILAVLNNEVGSSRITPDLLSRATASAVNLAEVQTILVREGGDPDECWALATDPIPEVEPFTAEQARIAGELVQKTRALGLSLGDRACLALALSLGAPVYTTDRLWKKLKLDVPVFLLR